VFTQGGVVAFLGIWERSAGHQSGSAGVTSSKFKKQSHRKNWEKNRSWNQTSTSAKKGGEKGRQRLGFRTRGQRGGGEGNEKGLKARVKNVKGGRGKTKRLFALTLPGGRGGGGIGHAVPSKGNEKNRMEKKKKK